jgi:hypothetical protein
VAADPQQVSDRTVQQDGAADARGQEHDFVAPGDPTATSAGGGSTRASMVGSWIVLSVVALPVAANVFAEGRKDWQYQLAGLADPFLGRPAPGFTIAIGVVLTVLLAVGVGIVSFLNRRAEPREARSARPSRFRARWWFLLVAGWAAFALGIASVAVAGGQRVHDGTMRMTFGRPIASTIEIPATCRTPVGKPDVVAEVEPEAKGLHGLGLRNVATGERSPYPVPNGVSVRLLGDGSAATAYPLPNVPARPLPYIEMTLADGEAQRDPPIGFLRAYDYRVVDVAEDAMTGRARVEGARFSEPFGGGTGPGTVRWVNLEMPNDPWPPTITIDIEWTCRP